ncbi:uncharacterized protein LOC132257991 [Phlebotomus argentipes]|uniref:uncharacterized protein LOC132257991 n=1 Tax=Phlebotomus argentipes TaxID=94469 RepID=UPI0028930934|nr:uncharacterized protein LOC132257991 [Phlebotomus argentipes]
MKLLCGLLICTVIVSSAFALECYFCDPTNGLSCNDAANFKTLKCPTNQAVECVSVHHKSASGTNVTLRGCNPKGFCEHKDKIPLLNVLECHSCTKDLCNNSFQLNANTTIISLLIISVALFYSKLFR